MRYLGIDFGSKKVGLALSDEAGRMGFPHGAIPNDGRLIDYVRELIVHKGVDVVVMGESTDFSGNANPIMERAKKFVMELERTSDATVVWEPEMMTTQEARRDVDGIYTGSHAAVDASAAALILTSYLSRINLDQGEASTETDYDND
jgi:putative Holliday junction resolvase